MICFVNACVESKRFRGMKGNVDSESLALFFVLGPNDLSRYRSV